MPRRSTSIKNNSFFWTLYPVQKDYAVLILILAAGTFLRFNGLDEPGMWLDEVSYTTAAQRPIINQILNPTETLGDYLSVDPTLSAIPFSLSLKLGFSNFLARFPAALFGILAIPLFYKLGRMLFGNVVGLTAALLLSISGFHVLYSQEARSYTGLVLFSIASFLFLYRATIKPNAKNWLFYTLFTWAGVSTSHLMIFTVASQGIILAIIALQNLFLRKQEPESLKVTVKVLLYFMLSLLSVAIFRSFWLSDFTQRQCYGCAVGNPSYKLDLVTSFGHSFRAFSSSMTAIGIGLVVLSLLGLTLLSYQFPKKGILLGGWLTLSILVTSLGLWFISQFYHERYTIWGLPAFLLAVAYGIISLVDFTGRIMHRRNSNANLERATRVVQLALVGLILIPVVASNFNQIQQIPKIKQAWPLGQLQEATSKIASEADNQDTIIALAMPARLLRFYLDSDRPDLVYLDENSFVERQTAASLPPKLRGRWYVFHARPPFNVPKRWVQSLNYWRFNDLIIIHFQDTCALATCLDETKTLLAEISEANPDSPLAMRISGVMTGLTLLLE